MKTSITITKKNTDTIIIGIRCRNIDLIVFIEITYSDILWMGMKSNEISFL
jgi:hypothetical protein